MIDKTWSAVTPYEYSVIVIGDVYNNVSFKITLILFALQFS
ncbi:hypothetical protein BSAE_1765 [Bifidobacterium pullorum subsp. saeculare DSM 6531 = LMG 14934]|uniref:Uncharacterized protein n=1 Tax=Bifidobacterium pullorum subsp. saeculare DSM 6531 = LMG 14934 TaxID=1437611 RepID=A0A087CXY0_9BIFI|nr:hypothetical protein BSAE_1765 [Bifidobacterium pullorum subsp. saeculare DSM 6531 = LMG 14934]